MQNYLDLEKDFIPANTSITPGILVKDESKSNALSLLK
jgi:hypothetical protein